MDEYSSCSVPSPQGVSVSDVTTVRRLHRFNCFQDIMLLTYVCELNPFEDRNIWESVAAKLSEVMPFISTRCCKERMFRLLNYYKTGNDACLRKKGTEEELTEKKRLLQEIKELLEDVGIGKKEKGKFPRRNLEQMEKASAAVLDLEVENSFDKTKDVEVVVDRSYATPFLKLQMRPSTDSSEELSGGECSEPVAGEKRKMNSSQSNYSAKRSANNSSIILDAELKFKMDELQVQKRKIALEERRLELDVQRFELEKQERREDRKMMLKLLEVALKRYDK